MSPGKLILGAALASALAGAGWFAWRSYSAPVPPEIRLDGVEKPTADAVRAALDAVRRQPRSGDAWGELAMTLAANGFHEQLADCYAHAEQLAPDTFLWPYLHGLYLLEVEPNRAIAFLQKAQTLTDDAAAQSEIHFRLTQALIEQDLLDEADRHVQALNQFEPGSPRVRLVRGLLELRRDNRAAAIEQLTALVESPFFRKRAVTLLAGLGDKKLTQVYQERAARLPGDLAWPDPIEARMMAFKVDRTSRFNEYMTLDKQGRKDEALRALRSLVAEQPDFETTYTLGYTLYLRGDLEEAEQLLQTALRYDSKNVRTRFLVGSCMLLRAEKLYMRPESKEQARVLFRQAVEAEDHALALQKEHGFAHLTRGWALKHLGRTEEALDSLRQALRILPDVADAHLYLGETLAEAGQLDEGIEHLKNAVRFARTEDRRPAQALEKWQRPASSKYDK